MGLNIGGNIKSIYFGGNIKEAYVGSQKVFSVGGGNVVHIGDNDYEFVQIGNLLWITEDLHENFGTKISTNGTTYYKQSSMSTINGLLPSGWRVPTDDDFSYVQNTFQGNSKKLISTEYGGTDDFGFNAKLKGYYRSGVKYDGVKLDLATIIYYRQISIRGDGRILGGDGWSEYGAETLYLVVRVCKDV